MFEVKVIQSTAGKLRFAARIYERMVSHNVAPSIHTCNTMIRLELV